jgi:dephospho-CoA kinase
MFLFCPKDRTRYGMPMPAIGITGGISTGKTTFAECLRELLPQASFFDADAVARQLVDVEDVKRELREAFGSGIFSARGDLNRKALRAIVFQDAAQKGALEKILHPRIRWQWSVEADKRRKSPEFFIADIPLLYETAGETLCDRVVVVACSPEIQLANLMRRANLECSDAEKMIAAQMPLEEKIKRADHVIWNNGDKSVLADQSKSLVELWRQEKWTK